MNLNYAILSTLLYHDIFNYPLTIEEINLYLAKKTNSLASVNKTLQNLIKLKRIGEHKKFYFAQKKDNLVQIRIRRAKYSQGKLKKANLYAKILKLNPFIQMIGVSGALAMENSHKQDDIDLVIITKTNLLWTTRLLSNFLLFPVKRKPGTSMSNNRACLNLFLDESDLRIKNQNIYIAHEICQLKPIWQRENAYYRFIKANNWVKKYLPNWKPKMVNSKWKIENRKGEQGVFNLLFTINYSLFENFVKNLQLRYMKNKITTEKVGEHQLFFHPSNTQEWVLKEYQKRLKRLNILR